MSKQENKELTDYEAQLYDRSIRLWGIAAQKRLGSAHVLLVGFNCLNAEICKNLVLAGIKSITLVDDEMVGSDDVGSHIFLHEDSLEHNRVEASLENVRALNPLVNVQREQGDVLSKDDSFFKQFDVVCASSFPLSFLVELDKRCRTLGVYFFAADCFGFYGYFFSDLREYHYIKEPTDKTNKKEDGAPEPPAKRAKLEITVNFVSLEEALKICHSSHIPKKRVKQFFGMQLLHAIRDGTDPETAWRTIAKDKDKLSLLAEEQRASFAKNAFAELVAVCAIVGGITAQEIIKIISANDAPINNFFFYDGYNGSGTVDNIN